MSILREKVLVLTLVAVVLMSAVAFYIYRLQTSIPAWSLVWPSEYVDVVTQMKELEEKGLFEDEIQLGLRSVRQQPSDSFLYQIIAQAYAYREYKEPQHASEWAKLASEYSEKALNADPNDLSNIFNVGQTYRIAGDSLPTSESCFYYQRAVDVLEKLAPKLQGNRATIQGVSFRLAPFREHNAEELARVKRELSSCGDRVPTNEPARNPALGEAATQMTRYARDGDYDKAVQTGLAALNGTPDSFMYQQIAMVYLMRSAKEPKLRDRWANEAASYARKSLDADPNRREFFNLYTAGRVLETAGDLSASARCEYYGEAIKAFSDQGPTLEGEYIALYGERRPLATFRNENQKALTRAREKFDHNHCR
jgi:tetratricopeptide (TPR) repeat protein